MSITLIGLIETSHLLMLISGVVTVGTDQMYAVGGVSGFRQTDKLDTIEK